MKRNTKTLMRVAASLTVGAFALAAYAADPAVPNGNAPANPGVRSNTINPSGTVNPSGTTTATTHGTAMTHTWRASQLEKMNVRNNAGEKIGAIEDLVVTPDGRVAYAALGFGGFLGMGEKLFAVPFTNLRIHRADNNSNEDYIVLNVSKEELKNAPGFDKSNWPNFADPNFTQKIDTYYRDHHPADQTSANQR